MTSARATQRIPIGATILVRGGDCSLAGPEIANGIAINDGWTPKAYRKGERVKYDPIKGLGDRDLQAMANGPIMDPIRFFLPAGKCSEDELRRREAVQEGN